MPKLWSDTIQAHRRALYDGALDATAALIAEHGLRSVTMSQIAERTGIGRATLYKYFADVDTILRAWHAREIARHLAHLQDVRDRAEGPRAQLESVLESYAAISYEAGGHDGELAAFLHRDEQVHQARHELRRMFSDLLAGAMRSGDVRDDVAPEELATYCVHALGAAGTLPSNAALGRLVRVTLAGLSPSASSRTR